MKIYTKTSILILLFLVCALLAVTDARAEEGRFNGFWKKDCKAKVGLQLMNFEADRYFISFCGRGGCMPPTAERPNTSIEDDPDYNIIDDENIQIYEEDGWEDYLKCLDL